MTVPRWYAVALPAYLAALLAVDTQVGFAGQIGLGIVTFGVLAAALRPLTPLARAQAIGVVAFATIGEVTGSLILGVYHYRLLNLPLFINPNPQFHRSLNPCLQRFRCVIRLNFLN